MTQFLRSTFAVAMAGSGSAMCREKGHSMIDSKGRCVCCGQYVEKGNAGTESQSSTRYALEGYRLRSVRHFEFNPQAARYAEILGGPHDGEIVSLDACTVHGTLVTYGGITYAVLDQLQGLVRLSYDIAP
jgi:hypothetical protein